jgi:HD-GYP domain-containing protein (c-di-GMP phosphodiesterase class II)
MADEHIDSRGETQQSFYAKQQLIDSARTAFQQISAVMKNVTLYPGSHPFLLTSADKLRIKIEEMLSGRKEVAFYLAGGELFFEKISIPVDQSISLIMEQLAARDVGGIIFRPGLTPQELVRLADLMNSDSVNLTNRGGIHEVIAKEGITHIELLRALLVDKQVATTIKAGAKKASDLFKEAIDTVKDMVQAVDLDKMSNLRKANTIVQSLVDNMLDNRDTLLGLTNLKMYDEYTFAHSVNTSILMVALGTYLSFEKPQIAALGMAGLMHDLGKMTVPHEIINKPGKLSDDEWEQVKRHPVEGALLLSDIPGVSKLAMVTAFEHHQHGGYPKVDGVPLQHLFSQIVAIADAYEALTAARVYYSVQMPADQAVRILIKKRGTVFNSILVKAFVNMIGIFPIGTVLKLDSGEVGLVIHQTRDLMRPRVLILSKLDGSEKEAGAEVSLLDTTGGRYKRTAVGTINPYAAKIDIKKYLT